MDFNGSLFITYWKSSDLFTLRYKKSVKIIEELQVYQLEIRKYIRDCKGLKTPT